MDWNENVQLAVLSFSFLFSFLSAGLGFIPLPSISLLCRLSVLLALPHAARTRSPCAFDACTLSSVLTSSQLGVSVSTTHCLIGAIAGVALGEGPEKLNKATLKRIFVSWIVTVPAAAAFALFFYTVLTPVFFSSADLSSA